MTNPTTPFSWQMPTSSDLVTDLPADFEVFGQAVATSMADLLGGTTGQILSKASNTDMDFTWITNDVGDITAVTAGTGISGGGTSGAVTITNSMATAIDAKGDLVAGTGADAFARLAVGTNGQVLTADSSAATGLAWATAGGSSGPAFRATLTGSNQSLTTSVFTKVAFNTETFDTDNCYDSTTNYRFTPNKAGYYQINTGICFEANTNARTTMRIYKNGSSINTFFDNPAPGTYGNRAGTDLVYCNGSTDYIEVFSKSDGTSPVVATVTTQFSGVWIRS